MVRGSRSWGTQQGEADASGLRVLYRLSSCREKNTKQMFYLRCPVSDEIQIITKSVGTQALSKHTCTFLKTHFLSLRLEKKSLCTQTVFNNRIVRIQLDVQAVRQVHSEPRGGDITSQHKDNQRPEVKRKWLGNHDYSAVESPVWTDSDVELILNITLRYKVNKKQENAI